MRTCLRVCTSAALIAIVAVLAGPGPRFATKPVEHIGARCVGLTEVRVHRDEEQRANRWRSAIFRYGADDVVRLAEQSSPALLALFELELLENLSVLQIEQPSLLVVRDDTGRDLSDPPSIERGRVEDQLITMSSARGMYAPIDGLVLHLAQPAREAASVDVRMNAAALVATRETEMVLSLPTEWAPLPEELGAPPEVEWCLETRRFQGDFSQTSLRIRPGWAIRLIASASLLTDEGEHPSGGGGSSGADDASMHFGKPPAVGNRARLRLRTGLQTLPIVIDMQGRPLP